MEISGGKQKGVVLSFDVETFDGKCGGIKQASADPEEEYFEYLPKLLKLLDAYSVRAHFFICGKVLELYGDAFRTLAKKGHGVGGHGYGHEVMSTLSRSSQSNIVSKVRSLINESLEIGMNSWRCPWLAANIQTYEVLKQLGIQSASNNRARSLIVKGVLEMPAGRKLDGEILGWQGLESSDAGDWVRHMEKDIASKNGISFFTMHTWVQKEHDPTCEALRSFLDHLESSEGQIWFGNFDDLTKLANAKATVNPTAHA